MPLLCGQPRLDCKAARFAAGRPRAPPRAGKLGSFQKATAHRRAARRRQNAAAAWDCTPTRLCWFNTSSSCAGTAQHEIDRLLAWQAKPQGHQTFRRARGCRGRWPASRPSRRAGPAAAGQFAQVCAAALRRCGHGRALGLPRWSTGVLGRLPQVGAAWSLGAVGTEDGGVCQESVRFSSGRPTPKLRFRFTRGCKSCLGRPADCSALRHGLGSACAGRRARDGLLQEEGELLL